MYIIYLGARERFRSECIYIRSNKNKSTEKEKKRKERETEIILYTTDRRKESGWMNVVVRIASSAPQMGWRG